MKEVFEKYSDEEHTMATLRIINILEKEYAIKIYRTTVRNDINDLIYMGIDLQT